MPYTFIWVKACENQHIWVRFGFKIWQYRSDTLSHGYLFFIHKFGMGIVTWEMFASVFWAKVRPLECVSLCRRSDVSRFSSCARSASVCCSCLNLCWSFWRNNSNSIWENKKKEFRTLKLWCCSRTYQIRLGWKKNRFPFWWSDIDS